jgi:hypothetical protein
MLVIHRNSGETVSVTLPSNLTISAVKKIKLSDIKPGSFVGTAATTGVDGKMTATEDTCSTNPHEAPGKDTARLTLGRTAR